MSHLIPICHAEAGSSEGGPQYGNAIDLTASLVNHDCKPNAFIFFQDGFLHVHALKKIEAGAEITASYCKSVLDVYHRVTDLRMDHFFECTCTRCCDEVARNFKVGPEFSRLIRTKHLGLIKMIQNVAWDHQFLCTQIIDEFKEAAELTANQTFPDGEWPAHYEMFGLVHLHIARCDSMHGRHCMALQGGFVGVLSAVVREGPAWCNRIFIMAIILHRALQWMREEVSPRSMVRLHLREDDLRVVLAGWLRELAWLTHVYFGGGDKYTKAVKACYRGFTWMVPKPGTKAFEQEFEAAQVRLLDLFQVADDGTPSKAIGIKLSH